MMLEAYYLNRKTCIETEMSYNGLFPNVILYNDQLFKNHIKRTTLLFKYDTIDWEVTEQINKANLSFCIYVILPLNNIDENVFEVLEQVNKAILSRKDKTKVGQTHFDILSTYKMKEEQHTGLMRDDSINSNCFIWQMHYRTTLQKPVINEWENIAYTVDDIAYTENLSETISNGFEEPFFSEKDQRMYKIIKESFSNN